MEDRTVLKTDKVTINMDNNGRYYVRAGKLRFYKFFGDKYRLASYVRRTGLEDEAALFIQKERLYEKINPRRTKTISERILFKK